MQATSKQSPQQYAATTPIYLSWSYRHDAPVQQQYTSLSAAAETAADARPLVSQRPLAANKTIDSQLSINGRKMLFAAAHVADAMKKGTATLRPGMLLQKAANLLEKLDVSSLPVIGPDRRCLGFLSRGDVLTTLGEKAYQAGATGLDKVQVQDAMTWLCFTQRMDGSLMDAVELLAYEQVHQLAVVDDKQRLLGILSVNDVTAWLLAHHFCHLTPRHIDETCLD